MQQDVFSQFRNSLNLPRHFKIKSAVYTESNESVFDSALNYLPIPASYSRTFTEVKGINIHVLSRLEEAIGSSAWPTYVTDWTSIEMVCFHQIRPLGLEYCETILC